MSNSSKTHATYSFGQFVLDVDRGALLTNGADVKLRAKSFLVLKYLVEHHGELISRDEILDTLWPDTVVTDDAVTQCLMDVRRAIGDDSQELIRTVPKRGYIFDTPVEVVSRPLTEDTPAITQANNVVPKRQPWIAVFLLVAGLLVTGAVLLNVQDKSGDTALEKAVSIAVLPFLDMSAEQDLEYFAKGISEELINVLASIPAMHVIARTSSFSYEEQGLEIASIQERLNVTHVLEGSVRKSADRFRITVQLIDASNSAHIWSETYDRPIDDLFVVQDQIAAEVKDRLTGSLLGTKSTRHRTNAEAYRLYLQAAHMINQLDFSKNAEAEALLDEALRLDPKFAPAWRELGRLRWRAIFSSDDVEQAIARTADALDRALSLDPEDAATLAYRAWHTADFEGDAIAGARMFEHAIGLEPANEHVVRTAVLYFAAFGRGDGAILLGQHGVSQNPLCYPCLYQLAIAYRNAGRLEEALTTVGKLESLFNETDDVRAGITLLLGRPEEVLTLVADEEDEMRRIYFSAMALHDLGRSNESRLLIDDFISLADGNAHWGVARLYAWTGNADAAFDALDRAATGMQRWVEGRQVRWNLQGIARAARDPVFQRLHEDARWQDFILRNGIAEQQLEDIGLTLEAALLVDDAR